METFIIVYILHGNAACTYRVSAIHEFMITATRSAHAGPHV